MRYILLCFYLFCVCFEQQKCAQEIVTNPKRIDGFGAQFQTIIYSAIYAELNNKKFFYTPFTQMEHNYSNTSDYIAKKEQLINFIHNFKINKNNTKQTVSEGKKAAIAYIRFFESNIIACANSLSLKKIKKIFRANKKYSDYFSHKNLNVVIHVRRPNSHDLRIGGTNVPDAVFLDIINALRKKYSSKRTLFHIYSQGNKNDFAVYKAHDVVLHINESLEKTFTSMVLAEVLVTSPSSLSYTAGILSDGIVYYIPFWHVPLPHWISVNTFLEKSIDPIVIEKK